MNSKKFEKVSKRFHFLNEIVKNVSCSKVSVNEIVESINKIEVRQIGFKVLSDNLLDEYWHEKDCGGTEEDHSDYERLFVIFNGSVKSRGFSSLEHNYGVPIASFFTNMQPEYLVVVRLKELNWYHYYDRVGGRNIEKLEIKIFLVDRNIVDLSQKITNNFWEKNCF